MANMPTYTVTVRRTVFYEALVTVDAEDYADAQAEALEAADEFDLDEFDPVDERDEVARVEKEE